MTRPKDALETVADLPSAQVAQAMLEPEGTPAAIPEEHLAGLDWRTCNALGGIRVQVAPEHAEAATAFLSQAEPIDPPELDRLANAPEPPTLTSGVGCAMCIGRQLRELRMARGAVAVGQLAETDER